MAEETSRGICGRMSCNSDSGLAVDPIHCCCFSIPVFRVVLYDAKGVDPEISYAKFARNDNGISVCTGHLRYFHASNMTFEIGGCGHERVRNMAPAVAQGNVPGSFICF